MKIFSAEQLYQADAITVKNQGIASADLMERAGVQIFNWLHSRMQGAPVPIHIFCGIGNNGGDGLVVGRMLLEHGYNVHMYVVNYSDKRSKDFLINYDRIKNITNKWPTLMKSEADFPEILRDDIIIDAIFGIGLNRSPEGWVKSLIQYVNNSKAFTLSIDLPSGMFANSASRDFEAIISSNYTLAFQSPKLAFFMPETGPYTPFFEVLDIGLDAEYLTNTVPLAEVIKKEEAQKFYKPRKKFEHKGNYGHALIIAGSYGKIGAAVLAIRASLQVGAGLVTGFLPKCGYEIAQVSVPEAMVIADSNELLLSDISYLFEPTAIGVGMGIGCDQTTAIAFEALLRKVKQPMVIDADGLNMLAASPASLKHLPKDSILTPHPGELSRLIGPWKDDYEKLDRAKKFVTKHNIVLVIKGANTITIYGDRLYINSTGNPGMATAGSGDVLAGVITGLLAQGYDASAAAIFGVYLHGSAGDIAAQNIGMESMIASDISDNLGNAYHALFENQPERESEAT